MIPTSQGQSAGSQPSVNALAAPLVSALVAEAAALRVAVERLPEGTTLVDAGIDQPGGLEAGRRIAEICMGGLGRVSLLSRGGRWPVAVSVHSSNPVLACLASQYAGWSLSAGAGEDAFHALGSGPARALAVREELFNELGYRDRASHGCLVLEVDKRPPAEVVDKVARDCGIAPQQLTLILTPTRSLAGVVQVVARVLEVALHKVHALGFPLERVIDGAGNAPIPPPAADFIVSMGRTNDAILFAGQVHLFVDAADDDARELAERLPSCTSRDYGKPFAQVFKDYGYDFYRIDPLLFAPAQVVVSCLKSGRSFHAGRIDTALLDASFGGGGA
ncbi:methenyltetrahydromethanopterin cyclohydrolase [Pelomicrobium methylotrophicum]|uniref:Methenyltetrahydromethanopterin cyclohydrolase n=1 Tax=Pelomicrobium methylotrophicum TaxID=2602750 RepID=A0A5C7EK27_9PROT|nr:methenyltetrahydromethanopterin cyclohydrolase [Pelomicrobium methylotrophicum]TXF12581.1 methenyltetrahydromethanopterin cyclohydrolase [Pelomicrobium methylotrophicum]